MRFARRRRVEVDGLPAPGRGDEYHLYQSLIGIWPVAEEGTEHDLTKRMCQYMDKAGHEAKQRTVGSIPTSRTIGQCRIS